MAEFKILKGWELETHAYHLLHEKSTEYYSRLNFYFMIPIIILSSSTGTLGLLNASETKFYIVNGVNIISIFIGIFGFVTAILTTIHNFLNIQKLESNHNNHAIEYSKISKEIKMHIYLSDTDVKVYSNIAEYIKQCKQNIDKLIESAPIIPSHVENSLDLKLKKIKNNHADEIDELITLVTHSDNIQPILTNDVNIKVLDTIESEESYKGNESKNIGRRMSEIIIINREEKENFENIKRNISEDGNSEDSGSTDDGRKSLDIINKLKNVEEREKFK